jgi:hypothetical protein
MALFKNLFIDACLKVRACWAQASSARPLLHATNVRDQPHPTIRAIDARQSGCVDQLSFRRTCQREFRDVKTCSRELCEQRGAVNEVERRRRFSRTVLRLVEIAHLLASSWRRAASVNTGITAAGTSRSSGPPYRAISRTSRLEVDACSGAVMRKSVSIDGARSRFA